MKKTWKKLLAAGCALSMLMTVPGVTVLADGPKEEVVVSVAGEQALDVDEYMDNELREEEEPAEDILADKDLFFDERVDALIADEETVNVREYTVGDGVTAILDKETGVLEFYSSDGTLWKDWLEKSGLNTEEIISIRVALGTVYLPEDSSYIFSVRRYWYDEEWDESGYTTTLEQLNLNGFDTSRVTDMSGMFYNCDKLTELDLSGFDTSNVTVMNHMFDFCLEIENLDLSSFITSKVKDMGEMFYMCMNLTTMDISGFDTSNVTDMSGMFAGCSRLTELGISNFDTSNVTDMNTMFSSCSRLTELNISNFDTSNVMDMSGMFAGCSRLTKLETTDFDTSNVTDMSQMFSSCSRLPELDVSNFDTSNVKDMTRMFSGCSELTHLDVKNFSTLNVWGMYDMFGDCSKLLELDLSGFDTSNVTFMSCMFDGCESLTSLDLSNFLTSKVESMYYLVRNCKNLTILDMSNFDTSNVEDGNNMFLGCEQLSLLITPSINNYDVGLPHPMYDESGNEYTRLPTLSKSIILSSEKPVVEIDICDCSVFLAATNYTYDGKAKKPSVTVKNGDVVLTSGMDYTVSYSDNTNAGTGTVTVIGTGNYKGEKSVTFTINKADAKLTFAESAVTKKTSDAVFTNTLTKTTDGTVTFKSGDTKVATVDSTSGLVTIKSAGTTTITATASEGQNYKAGSASYTLKVEAPAPTPTPTPAASGFSDVQDPKHAYYKAIYWAADEGITKGYPDGTFGINKSCTRGEMIMFLWRYAGKPAPKAVSKSPFKDVAKSHAFYKAILWASQKGITKGYPDGTFGIDRNVSRGECMMFLWRVKGKPAPKAVAKSPFKDVATTNAFYKAILWGYQKKITTGYTSGAKKGTFGINENCTRGQIVTFLYRAK